MVHDEQIDPKPSRKWRQNGIKTLGVRTDKRNHLDLTDLFIKLADLGLTSVLVEGGGTLATALLEQDLVDLLILFTAGLIIDKHIAKSIILFGFINNNAFDIAQPDVGNVGGITEFKHVQSLAYANGIHVYPHVWGTSIMIAASLHLASTFNNLPISSYPKQLSQEPIMEFDQSENPIRYKISKKDPFKFDNGYLHVPSSPGLGVEIDEEAIEEFATEKL